MARPRCKDMVGKSFTVTRTLWARDGVTVIPKGTTVRVEGSWRGLFHVIGPNKLYIRMVERGALEGA